MIEIDDYGERLRPPANILVTGSEGIIGKAIFEEVNYSLYYEKDKVWGLDKKDGIDIADFNKLNSIVKAMDLDYVIHLAANADEHASWEEILTNNIIGTHNVYEAARRNGVRRVVFASSTHIIGAYVEWPINHPQSGLFKADTPIRPDSDYGASKAFGEALARQYYDKHGIESICIRIGSVTPDDKPLTPYEKLWLSHRDVAQVFREALFARLPSGFGIYYATSKIPNPVVDIRPTIRDLGYRPEDKLKI